MFTWTLLLPRPKLCFCRRPFSNYFLMICCLKCPLSVPGLPVWKHRPRLSVVRYKNSLLKLLPWLIHSCEWSRLEWPHQVILCLLRTISACFWEWVWADFENGSQCQNYTHIHKLIHINTHNYTHTIWHTPYNNKTETKGTTQNTFSLCWQRLWKAFCNTGLNFQSLLQVHN